MIDSSRKAGGVSHPTGVSYMANNEALTVSCVCITGRSLFETKKLLPIALRSYEVQTYPANLREIILVHDNPECAELVEMLAMAVNGVSVQAPKGLTLGELRNIGLDAAQGELAIQWDGDDVHHPERIGAQVAAYSRDDRLPVFLQRQLCYCVDKDVAFVREHGHTWIHGTILHENLGRYRYPKLAKTEDTAFMRNWEGCHILDNPPELYLRLCHKASTSGHAHVMREHAEDRERWFLDEEQTQYLQGVIAWIGRPLGMPERSATG